MAAVDAIHEQIVVSLLGGEGFSVNAVLRSIKSHHERAKLTLRLIDLKLEKIHRELFNLINRHIEPIRDIRNKFAHGLWGECQSVPESLILGENRQWVDIFGAGLQIMASESRITKARDFLSKLLTENNIKYSLDPSDRAEITSILMEMGSDTSIQKVWSWFAQSDETGNQMDAEVWTPADALLAAKAAEAAYVTTAAFSGCVGPLARDAEPLLAKVRSQGLLHRNPYSPVQ
ncbi:hypothetical protein H009_14703 [Agrobacterium tumefaciens str. Cherry 2E-2-2]|nr:hypothetical protein H009_14703 [Agrobacterium tumefaciens str. Cherry 2E-2-2]